MSENQTSIICINSVKGGAGKTTIALSLACTLIKELAAKYEAEKNKLNESSMVIKEPKVCFIDLDIMGTGAKYTIYGESSIKEDIKYLNDINITEDYDKFLNYFEINKEKFQIDCLLMNDDPREKSKFIKSVRIHTSKVNIDIFISKVKKIIKEIVTKNSYDYIIIDCAPSYESCSQNIYDFLVREIGPNYKEVKCIYNLFVSTLDRAHVINTISSVNKIINSTQDNLNVKIILNDTFKSFGNDKDEEKREGLKNNDEEKRDKLRNRVFEQYERLRKKEMDSSHDKHEPSESKFTIKDIIIKKYSEIVKYMNFGDGKQLNGTDLGMKIQDRDFVREIGIEVDLG